MMNLQVHLEACIVIVGDLGLAKDADDLDLCEYVTTDSGWKAKVLPVDAAHGHGHHQFLVLVGGLLEALGYDVDTIVDVVLLFLLLVFVVLLL